MNNELFEKQVIQWIHNNSYDLKDTSRAKLYVAITRARYSVGIVYDYTSSTNIEGVKKYKN